MRNPFRGVSVPVGVVHPLDEGKIFQDAVVKFGSRSKVAFMLDISESYVYQRIRLLSLPDEVKDALRSGAICLNHAYEIAVRPINDALKLAQGRSVRDFRRRLRV